MSESAGSSTSVRALGLRSPLPSREELEGCERKLLSRGGWANPDVSLIETPTGAFILKDFAPRSAWVRPIGRWITRRELRAYAALAGHRHVPRVLGEVDALAFCLEYRPGERLSRALRGRLPAQFLSELSEAISAMHAAGVVHLDLRHRSNILACADGHPVLIDFASAVCFSPGGLAARTILPLLAAIDRLALRKWEARLGP